MDFALFETVRSFYHLSSDSKLDDDYVDRLNRYWTAIILVLSAVVLSAKQIVGEPMKCWTPQEFKKPWIQYAEDYCWVKNTYFVPKSEELAKDPGMRRSQEIGYYQWIPYMLTVQAFLYYLPAMLWRLFNWKSGLDLATLVSRAAKGGSMDGIGYQLSTNMRIRSQSERRDVFFAKNFLTCLYLVTKLMYTINAVGQFFLLSSFFGRSVDALFLVARDLALGVEWHQSGHFPRVTFCDFSIRRLGNINSYSIQCVLAINIFTEKVFVFVGFWMLLVACLTVLNFVGWLIDLLLPWRRLNFLRNLSPESGSARQLRDLLETRLGTDGLLVLHLVAANSDERVARRLLSRLLADFAKDRQADEPDFYDGSGSGGSGTAMMMQPVGEEEKPPL